MKTVQDVLNAPFSMKGIKKDRVYDEAVFLTCFSISNECWEWQGGRSKNGYGVYRAGGRCVGAHRYFYMYFNRIGLIPPDLQVCHRCDNPPCVNPAHLFLGDTTINWLDSNNKGRRRYLYGQDHHNSRLTADDVRFIRELWFAGVPSTLISRTLGKINARYIRQIAWGKTWKHIT